MRRINLQKEQTAGPSTVRDINRRIVLNYVRDREPISRADIARATALQRSTVSVIVEHLTADGLIEEIGAGASTGGRRPTLLRLRAAGAMAIGVDISPTTTTVAASDLAGRILERAEFKTNEDGTEMMRIVAEAVRSLAHARSGKHTVSGVGISVPGMVDTATGTATYVPYFQWRDLPIAEHVGQATGLEVLIDNDANAVALAELWFGRPEVHAARDFIAVMVGEGIGTGIIFDGQIYRGERGAAGEFGHMIVGKNAPVACSCGNYDCWEAFASERATVARYAQRLTAETDREFCRCAEKVAFPVIVERALSGEQAAHDTLIETAHYLGIGISNLIVGLSPEAVVVGGTITRAWSLIETALKETIAHSIRRGLPSASILASTLGTQPTLMGAFSLVLARKFASLSAP